MTASNVLFDSWAWWEVLRATPRGTRLARRYLDAALIRVHSSAISVGELAAKLLSLGHAKGASDARDAIAAHSTILDVTPELAFQAGLLRERLRARRPDASLADAIVLATGRSIRARIISNDGAFAGLDDVSAS